ncbi:unnamed protein product [Hydatigera taeniaeformis]|uniref:Uncharacterized protein n=1 Tax=Hydatigena taeniaeformis TaxID=6205 RepID=A0A3P7G9E5_HYDTA|nr:unnamed protein product [Hydatigera taeniaeformis]
MIASSTIWTVVFVTITSQMAHTPRLLLPSSMESNKDNVKTTPIALSVRTSSPPPPLPPTVANPPSTQHPINSHLIPIRPTGRSIT